jgi:hypothetical protein
LILAGVLLCLVGGLLLLLGWRALPSAVELAQNPTYWRGRPRWGVGVADTQILLYNSASLRLGWYLDWAARADPARPDGVEYAQMVWGTPDDLRPGAGDIVAIAQANPGSLWLVGNEPDVIWQGNMDPATYASFYYQVHTAVRAADPSAQIAIGGVSQPTPLRLRYLDAVLASYEDQFGAEMPIDVWNIHNFILREEEDAWGVGVPPGLSDEGATHYEIEDCDDLDIFRRQVVEFRRWMADRGYQDWPLIVSEYGIPMPEDYGFSPERVSDFLVGTFDFFLTAVDSELGCPADDYRLVQRWCWYSLADTVYPTGNLFDPVTGDLTALGRAWVGYVEGR